MPEALEAACWFAGGGYTGCGNVDGVVGYAARSSPGPRRLALLLEELLAPVLAMLRYSRFPWLSIVDYCRQDSCNVLYYREIDPAAGTSEVLAWYWSRVAKGVSVVGKGRVFPL